MVILGSDKGFWNLYGSKAWDLALQIVGRCNPQLDPLKDDEEGVFVDGIVVCRWQFSSPGVPPTQQQLDMLQSCNLAGGKGITGYHPEFTN